MIWPLKRATREKVEEMSGSIRKLAEEISSAHKEGEVCPILHVPCPLLKKKNGKG